MGVPPKAAAEPRSFIERARRAQITQCAADAIAEVGYANASMAEIAKRAGISKSVISYHFDDKDELILEVVQTNLATFAEFMAPLMAVPTATEKLRAYVTGAAAYMSAHRSLHLAVIEIGFNALGADGRPMVSTMPLRAPEPSVEDILLQGQREREFRDFDVNAVAGVIRSAITHSMVLAARTDPGTDLAAYADEIIDLIEPGIRLT